MGKPIFALALEEARAELLRAAPGTWRQDMLRVRIAQLKRKESNGDLRFQIFLHPAKFLQLRDRGRDLLL